ncbi:hypothetical protein L3X07_03610 [Levilactobacillus brevis]|nr:hypothetical protein [Levilactobacillus brevis]
MESRTKERLGATLRRLTDDEQFDTITVKRLVLKAMLIDRHFIIISKISLIVCSISSITRHSGWWGK